jgi:3-methyladenine DNA glycosylase AlkD
MSTPAAPREDSLERVREYVDGTVSAIDLAHDLNVALSGLSLYPTDTVLDIGQAAGQLLERKPEAAVTAVLQLVSSENRETRAVACAIIGRLARYSPAVWAGIVRHLATDADWEVRSFAARVYDSREGYAGAVEFHTDWVFEELTAWVKDDNYLLRHAATEALLGYLRSLPDVVSRVLKLLEPLLNDAAEYVGRGLVMALRTMGRTQPSAVFDFLEAHLPPASEEGREVFQLVLEQRFADKDPARKQELLAKLGS